jgi:hypothetical protein
MSQSAKGHTFGIDGNVPYIFISILLISALFAIVWLGSLLLTAAITTVLIHHIIGMVAYFNYQGPKIVTLASFSTIIALTILL